MPHSNMTTFQSGASAGANQQQYSKAPLKGLFDNGIWKCNCDPRMPAEYFQTKNGGKNHGRWFYTCQKAQNVRCNFFLWADDAKPREAAVLMSNFRSEAPPAPPPSTSAAAPPPTQTQRHPTPPADGFSMDYDDNDDDIAQLAHDFDDATNVNRTPSPPFAEELPSIYPTLPRGTSGLPSTQAPTRKPTKTYPPTAAPTTPRKAARTHAVTSPGKRAATEPAAAARSRAPPSGADDPFTTPTSKRSTGRVLFAEGVVGGDEEDGAETGLPTPKTGERPHRTLPWTETPSFTASTNVRAVTPTPTAPGTPKTGGTAGESGVSTARYRDVGLAAGGDSALAKSILSLIASGAAKGLGQSGQEGITLSEATKRQIAKECNMHVLKMQGVSMGRDVARLAIKAKEARIAELEWRVGELEAEKEMERMVGLVVRGERRQ